MLHLKAHSGQLHGFPVKFLSNATAVALFLLFSAGATAQTAVAAQALTDIAQYPQRFAPATVVSLNQPGIAAQISAQIAAVPVRVGDTVKAGDLLVQLDCTEYQLNRDAAKANLTATQARLELARNQLQRTESLIERQLVSVEDLDARRTELSALAANLQASQAQLNLSELQVSRCQIRAPFNALVLSRTASVGQLVNPGTVLTELLDLESMELSAQIFSGDANQLAQADALHFETGEGLYPVQLITLVAALDPSTRNREARLKFIEDMALPGSSGKLRWNDPNPHLPADYLVERDGQLGFFVLDNNRAHFEALPEAQPGRNNPVKVPLSTRVITEGFAGLSEGTQVSVSGAR